MVNKLDEFGVPPLQETIIWQPNMLQMMVGPVSGLSQGSCPLDLTGYGGDDALGGGHRHVKNLKSILGQASCATIIAEMQTYRYTYHTRIIHY